MKKSLYLLIVLGLAVMWVGCKKSEPVAPKAPKKESAQVGTPAASVASTAFTLVTLKVPHMV
jgi:hypothetical protein